MTNEEAIIILKNLQDWLYFSSINGGTKIQREAIDIAIKALEEKEKSNKISNNNPFSYYRVPVYNPYTGVVRFHEHNVVDANNLKW